MSIAVTFLGQFWQKKACKIIFNVKLNFLPARVADNGNSCANETLIFLPTDWNGEGGVAR